MGTMRACPYQNNNAFSKAYSKWFFRPFYEVPLNVDDLAEHIAKDSKLERSKVSTITSAIMKQMGELLCNGHPIRVPHLGLMKLGATSKGVETLKEYNAGTEITDLYVLLTPNKEIKNAIRGIKFMKYIKEKKTPV